MKSNSVTILIIAIGDNRGEGGGERDGVKVPLIINYTRTLSPKGAHFTGWRYIKGKGFHELKYSEG